MILYLVIPCYNEQEVLHETAKQLKEKINSLCGMGKISPKSRIVFVDDGSKDKTWEIISELHKSDSIFRGIKLSRNKGHQNALMAGLMTVKDECDAAVSLDKYINEKYDIVYGVRSARKTDTYNKKFTAESFYKIMSKMGVEVTYNHADYRLMSKRALDALEQFKEVNLFLRGMVPMVGYKSDVVYYERKERFAGESKYPLKKMLSFAMEGITSLSIKPIRMITALGVGIFTVSIIMLIYFLIRHFMGATVQGWTSIVVSVWAIGGLQLLSIGVIGEYIGKIYLETKRRPNFIVETYLNDESEDCK